MSRLSIDFDGTMSRPDVQKYAKELVDRGYEVWIVTRRYDTLERYTEDFLFKYKIMDLREEHKYLFDVADECGIPRNQIQFMNMEDKWKFFKGKDFIWHLDDDKQEIRDINAYTNTIGISVMGSYRNKCERIIKMYDL